MTAVVKGGRKEADYTTYDVETSLDGKVVGTSTHRYSELLELKETLQLRWPAVEPLPFPPKSVFGRFESTIIAQRTEAFTDFLAQALLMKGVKDSYELVTALNVEAAQKSPCLVVHGSLDRLMPLPHGVACAKALPGAELLVLEMAFDVPPAVWEPVFDAIQRTTGKAAK